MLNTVYRSDPSGLFIYKNDGKFKDGYYYDIDYLKSEHIVREGVISKAIYYLEQDMKLPMSSLYAIARAINKISILNKINWLRTFNYLEIEKEITIRKKIYDRQHFGGSGSEYYIQDRYYEIKDDIQRLQIDQEIQAKVETMLITFGLV